MSDMWAFRNNADDMWQASAHEPDICYEKRHVLACPFCEGEPAPLDENDHTSCTTIWCGSTAYMHVDAWNNRPAMKAYARIEELEAELGGWEPIETAPKDGTIVDLWHKDGFRITDEWWIEDGDDGFWSGLFLSDSFTHWMPVPTAPEVSK